MWAVWAACLLSLAAAGHARKQCVPEYNTSSARVPGKINIHLVPHTHDDTGWLKTIDQYYYGSRQDIQLAGVQYVLDTVIYALLANPNRKFSYAEMSFFTRWWDEQTDSTQEAVKKLVSDGRLNFINGGWVQHDEAASHYVAMIDQTTRGHRFLEDTFGYRPTVGWQIDPFGHSSTQASLMAGFLGFNGLFFGRSDYQDLALRKKKKQLEFLWRGGESFGKEADVFTGSFPTGNYGPPGGFYFDWGNWDPPVQDNICLTELNVDERVDDFVRAAEEYAELYQDSDIFWPMGTDFTYSNAFTWYKNMDKLIHYVNKDGRVNAFYSDPADYVKIKHSLNTTWPLKTDDFFPYADCETCYWTGYFTSRPASKGYIKAGTSYLQIARQLELLTDTFGASEILEEAVALLQHHDSITGTEKQHVANDYHKRLARGWAHAERFVSKALSHLVYNTAMHPLEFQQDGEKDKDLLLLLQQCPFLNVSVCEISVASSKKKEDFLVVAYNPLAWSRTSPIRVPVESDDSITWQIIDADGADVEVQEVPVSKATKTVQDTLYENGALPRVKHVANAELVFIAELPPLGYATFRIGKKARSENTGSHKSVVTDLTKDSRWNKPSSREDDLLRYSKGPWTATLSASTGRLTALESRDVKKAKMSFDGEWYKSSVDHDGVASGAYIFRPDGLHKDEAAWQTTTIHGPVLTEIRLDPLEFLSLTVRLWHKLDHIEVEWTAGPIPIDDNNGKEVIIKYKTDLDNADIFKTDSNGRELLSRRLNYRPTWELNVTQPVAGNYYPLTAAISIQEKDKAELSVLVDRAQGGSSLKSGEIEVMVHRRTLLDDIRGVNEPLNETVSSCRFCDSPGLIVKGVHHVILDEPKNAARHRRQQQQLINDPVLLSFGPALPGPANSPQYSAMPLDSTGLPRNVQLLTTKLIGKDEILLRIAHLFQVGEDAGDLTKPVEIDLNKIFAEIQFDSVEEYGLAGAQKLDTINRLHFKEGEPIRNGHVTNVASYTRSPTFHCQKECLHKTLVVTLQPMEIRTFVAHIVRGNWGSYEAEKLKSFAA